MRREFTSLLFILSLFSIGFLCNASPVNSTDDKKNNEAETDTIEGKQLMEVEFVHENIKRRANQDLVTITSEMRKGQHSTGELLGQLQGMFYNPISKTLSYNNSSNIKILVDSIEKDESYIKQLRHNRFDKIDVIYRPTGQYRGYDVLINMRTRPDYQGYEGSILEVANFVPGNRNGKDLISQWANIGQFSYMRDKISLDVMLHYSQVKIGRTEFYSKSYPLNGVTETTMYRKRSDPAVRFNSEKTELYASFDYRFNKANSISATYKFNISPTYTNTSQRLSVTDPSHQQPIEIDYRQKEYHTDSYTHNAGINFRGGSGFWSYNASVKYSNWKYNSILETTRRSLNYADNRHNKIQHIVTNANVMRWTNNMTWMFNLSYDNFLQNADIYNLYDDHLISKSKSHYHNWSFNTVYYPDDNLNFSLSLDLQYSHYKNGENTQNKVSPSTTAIAYARLGSKSYVRGFYTFRYTPPYLSNNIDYAQFTDSLIMAYGNPLLKGTLNHFVSANIGITKMFTIHGSFNIIPDQTTEMYGVETGLRPDGIVGPYATKSYRNTYYHNWNVSVIFQKTLKNWNLRASVGYSGKKAKLNELSNKDSSPNGMLSATYNLHKHDFSVSLYYNYNKSFILTPQRIESERTDQLSLAVNKSFFKQKLNITLSYISPLHFTSAEKKSILNSPGLIIDSWGSDNSRYDNLIQLQVTYRFWGGGKIKKFNDKNFEEIHY